MLPPGTDLIAEVTWEQAIELVDWDHHRVRVQGKPAVLITYHWHPMDHEGTYLLVIVFAHALRHPPVSEVVQAIVDTLEFKS